MGTKHQSLERTLGLGGDDHDARLLLLEVIRSIDQSKAREAAVQAAKQMTTREGDL